MANFETVPWSQGTKIQVIESRGFELSDMNKKVVDQIWFESRDSHHFNGQILNYLSFENQILLGEFVEYKFYYAQTREPSLKELLQIRPVAISGLTTTANKLLMGQRSEKVTEYQKFYEVVPSGKIDAEGVDGEQIDLFKQFQRELWEESGLSSTDIRDIIPFAFIYDKERDSYEICAEIHVNYLAASENLRSTEEYQKLTWILKSDLENFIKRHASECVPLTLHLLQQKNLLKPL